MGWGGMRWSGAGQGRGPVHSHDPGPYALTSTSACPPAAPAGSVAVAGLGISWLRDNMGMISSPEVGGWKGGERGKGRHGHDQEPMQCNCLLLPWTVAALHTRALPATAQESDSLARQLLVRMPAPAPACPCLPVPRRLAA